jgi:hypothetical protein
VTPNRDRDESEALDPLHRLAAAWGVETSFVDNGGELRRATAESLVAILRALGAPIETAADAGEALRHRELNRVARRCQPTVVAWGGKIPELGGGGGVPRGGLRLAPGAAIELEDASAIGAGGQS